MNYSAASHHPIGLIESSTWSFSTSVLTQLRPSPIYFLVANASYMFKKKEKKDACLCFILGNLLFLKITFVAFMVNFKF